MLNAYGYKFKYYSAKCQHLFCVGVLVLFESIFDRPAVKGALSFYIKDELDIIGGCHESKL